MNFTWMHEPVFQAFGIAVNGWKLVGYVGVLLFAGRWVVQCVATRQAGRPTVTKLFWIMSVIGSVLSLLYFIYGKSDSVGVLSTVFTAIVSAYNLWLQYRMEREGITTNTTPTTTLRQTDECSVEVLERVNQESEVRAHETTEVN